LWHREHNQRHHRFNNIRGLDYAWVPWSPQEYACASLPARMKYCFYRDPGGVFFYYLFEIWAQRKIWPQRAMVGTVTAVQVLDCVLIWGFAAVYLAALAAAGAVLGRPAIESAMLAFVLPFLIFSMLISIAIYLHHTHYLVPWYRDVAQWTAENGALYGTVHVRLPWPVRLLILHIMEHTAHHMAPTVPLYRLDAMQDTVAGPDTVTYDFTVPEYFQIGRRCKLFDYERGRWTDYDGNDTSEPLFRRSPVSPGAA
jgi:omega-6 fatty acid desaturase (delta-12 desaturase)